MKHVTLILGAFLCLTTASWAATYVVKPNGNGDFPTIQAAVDEASDGDVILLHNGTFRGDGNRDINFNGKAITVRGRSGNPKNCIIDAEGTPDEPRRGLLFNSGEGPESILEYVTVTGGYSPIALTVPAGGAINVTGFSDPLYWTSPTIRHCRFIDNDSPYATGGVNFFLSNGSISDCYFSGNWGEHAAGALAISGYSNVTVERCVFEQNTSDSFCGALFAGFFDGDVTVATVNDCIFRGNTAGFQGGALGVNFDVTMILNRCFFEGSYAPDMGGVGIGLGRGRTEFNGCTFAGNSSGRGGVLGLSGESAADFHNCTMYGNTAADGSGFYVEDGTALAANNTIISFGYSGTACSGPAVATFSCSDIYGNEGGDWVGSIADQLGVNGNISLDPRLVNPEHGIFTLKGNSPCRPFSPPNEECDLIGAWSVGNGHGHDTDDEDDDAHASHSGSLQFSNGLLSGEPTGAGSQIRYAVTQSAQVKLVVYDATGRLVRSLVDGEVSAGVHTVLWKGRDEAGRAVAPGVYFSNLRLDGRHVGGGKIVVVR